MTVVGTAILVLLSALAVGASWLTMSNAVRRHRDVRLIVAERKAERPRSASDPLAIFTREEIRLLTISPRRSWVRGTRFFRHECPDPWAEGFEVEDHLWAVYANRLRDMAGAGKVVTEVVVVLASGVLGVLLTLIAEQSSDRSANDWPGLAVAVTLLIVAFAVMVKVTLLREWQAAAERYRQLATTQVARHLEPDRDGAPTRA